MLLFILIALITFAYIWIKKVYTYWQDRGFSQDESLFPYGSFKGVGKDISAYESLRKTYKKFKGKTPAVGFYAFLSPNILILDPELVRNVLQRDFHSFNERGMYHNERDDPTSTNVLTLDGQEWKDRRVKLTPLFTSGKMKMMFDIIDSISDKLVSVVNKSLMQSSEQEMRIWSQRFTADNIGNIAFGLECSCLEDEKSAFMKYGRRMFDLTNWELFKFIFCGGFPKISRALRLRMNPKEAGDFFLDTFLQTFNYREKNNIQRNDLVSMLLQLKDSFTPVQLAAESTLVFLAGYETSSTLMTFALYELSQNPDIQQRLREEITDGIEENDGKLTYDMLFSFKYLDMVINESLRKYPPIPNNVRKSTEDYQIPGSKLIIPKGVVTVISTFSLQNDPEYYPNPDKFDPERFSDENHKKIHPFTFMPFGEGNRQCLGMRFGLMQSKMGIAKLIKNFSFSPCEKTPIPMKFVASVPFLQPVGGMWLKVDKI